MANGIRTGNPHGFNKGRSWKFHEGSWVQQTPEEGRRTYWLKCCVNNNKDEDNSLKTLNDKKKTHIKLDLRPHQKSIVSHGSAAVFKERDNREMSHMIILR